MYLDSYQIAAHGVEPSNTHIYHQNRLNTLPLPFIIDAESLPFTALDRSLLVPFEPAAELNIAPTLCKAELTGRIDDGSNT